MKATYNECRICGKKYQACGTHKVNTDQFQWQDVACCPEHGAEYLKKILESRKKEIAADTENEEKTENC